MEKISSTMVIHKYEYGANNRLSTMSGPLDNIVLEKWLRVIRTGTYQAESEDIRWSYEPVFDLWLDIESDSDSRNDGLSDAGNKDQ